MWLILCQEKLRGWSNACGDMLFVNFFEIFWGSCVSVGWILGINHGWGLSRPGLVMFVAFSGVGVLPFLFMIYFFGGFRFLLGICSDLASRSTQWSMVGTFHIIWCFLSPGHGYFASRCLASDCFSFLSLGFYFVVFDYQCIIVGELVFRIL